MVKAQTLSKHFKIKLTMLNTEWNSTLATLLEIEKIHKFVKSGLSRESYKGKPRKNLIPWNGQINILNTVYEHKEGDLPCLEILMVGDTQLPHNVISMLKQCQNVLLTLNGCVPVGYI